ncbi:helix-turn-helix transcriptional regulator [Paenarthrobacter sp. Z7-10]|uniref:helix-turn-helix transcriptional regulator n=1 Tax=Paenarthrobacter sp. Z7-10 TaxID=2787635 RepID=UPI0022A9F4A3|nr:LuxR C-terminal-related transcriptional regulator [Paenarthrobacter sp. Z7-10]MCZ2402960.1 helix-turn-helix transcriptional regulator [Paenarthrobacter sp. Z7-10]
MNNSQNSRLLVGHDALVASIAAALKDPGRLGVVVVGDAGFGKTALAQAVLGALGPKQRPFRISPSTALVRVRFGALARFLDPTVGAEVDSPPDVLSKVQRSLVQRLAASGSEAVLVIDDAHNLDEDSARVIAQLAVTGAAKLLVLSRPKPAPPAEFLSLWSDGLLSRFDLGPLTGRQAHELCEQVLAGEVLTSASAALAKVSGGNPLFLLALIAQARRLDQLVERNQVWLLRNYHPTADLHLTDLVREQLLRRTPAELEVLQTVALAEPLPLSWLCQAAGEAEIDALEEDNLISISKGPRRLVRSAYPLFGEVVRQLVPAARSRRIRARILEVMDGPQPSPESLVRFVNWSLDCGATVPEQQLLQAAGSANRNFDPTFALRAAEAVKSSGNRTAAKIEMAHAHYHRGDLKRAASLLEHCIESAADGATVRAASLLTAWVHLGLGGRPAGLIDIADTWRKSAVRISSQAASNPDTAMELAQPAMLAQRAHLRGSRLMELQSLQLQGRFAGVEAELRELAGAGEPDAESRLVALMLLAELLTCTGRPEGAVQATTAALQVLAGDTDSRFPYYEYVLIRHAFALVRLGKFGDVAEVLADFTRSGLRSELYFSGALQLIEGLVALAQGQMPLALRKLATAIEALREVDLDQLLPYALGLASYAASLAGRRDLVASYSEALGNLPYEGSLHFHLLARAYSAASQAALYGASESVQELRQLADHGQRDGLLSAEKDVRELALRLGDVGQLARLMELTDGFEGAEAACLNSYVHGIIRKDADQLMAASEQARGAGYQLLAAECLGQSVLLLQNSGDRKRARAAVHLLQLRRSELAGVSTLQLGGPDDTTELTPRERDIVTMVVNGQSNREIAAHSSLSVRTVEGHLYRIFTKLGINRREDLTSADITTARRDLSYRH